MRPHQLIETYEFFDCFASGPIGLVVITQEKSCAFIRYSLHGTRQCGSRCVMQYTLAIRRFALCERHDSMADGSGSLLGWLSSLREIVAEFFLDDWRIDDLANALLMPSWEKNERKWV